MGMAPVLGKVRAMMHFFELPFSVANIFTGKLTIYI
jgi:hypothetical protein